MKKRTKSLLEEINNMVHDRDKHLIIESKADHIIASAINLVQLINESYEGEEPSDDVRGTEHTGSTFTGQAGALYSWDPSPSYKGRNRYRGLITRCNVRNEGGRPDVWQFSFDFTVVKNEMQMRMVGRVG